MPTHLSSIPTHPRPDLLRWQQLVTPAWLAGLIRGQAVAGAPRGRWRLVEVGCGEPADFLHSHIPRACYLDTHQLEDGPFWNKVEDADLLAVLLALGVRHDTTVILYGRSTTAAARAAHLMLYAGVADVRLLDGAFAAWCHAGLPCASGWPAPHAAAGEFGAPFPGCPHYLMNTAQASSHLQQPGHAMVSIRTWEEFSGQTSGYRYILAKGDIAGALWGRAGDGLDVNSMSDFQNADGTMKSADEITRFWADQGIHPGLALAFYCGTGWRASLAFYYAWLMGWERISVYDGGWFEWSGG